MCELERKGIQLNSSCIVLTSRTAAREVVTVLNAAGLRPLVTGSVFRANRPLLRWRNRVRALRGCGIMGDAMEGARQTLAAKLLTLLISLEWLEGRISWTDAV